MKIKWGALVVDGRGKLGGHVASKNRGGSFLRTKVTPANPSTLAQTLVRTVFAVLSTAWSGLTSAQRESWNSAVEDFAGTDIFGDIKKPSGKNLHQKLNQNLLLIGESALVEAPAKLAFPEGIVTDATVDTTASTVTITGLNTLAPSTVVISSTGVISGGTKNAKNRFRNIFHGDPSAIGNPAAIYTAYVDRFGVPADGANVQFGVQMVLASGQKSPMQILTADVTS